MGELRMKTYSIKLSIGLPVYNGERFLAQALDSLLSQTFTDFELIISDNASTDRTADICQEYAQKDQRIRYFRNATNIGCACNFNRVLQLAKGEYFKWAAYDDLHAPNFLARCIEILDKYPSYILCHSRTKLIDEQGNLLQDYAIKLKTYLPLPQQRFNELLTKHFCYQLYGVMRRSALEKIPPMGGYGNADGILLLRLGLIGCFYEIPEYLFFARSHPQQSLSMFFPDYLSFNDNNPRFSLHMLPNFYEYAVWFDSQNKDKLLFPHWRLLGEYLQTINHSSMNWYARLCCYISIVKKLTGTESLLIKDLVFALQKMVTKTWKIFHRDNLPDSSLAN
ncbi:glycosyl transferase family 2 [Richelia sinica FACHB-800]|uniref:Glycosyl transferase family 2 n=2 Tax=Richelia TaxID=98443 RepID=A0A975T5M8_9NOST|nr:glycosyl transferase family 2 [Richelia sinica FACHB-800]